MVRRRLKIALIIGGMIIVLVIVCLLLVAKEIGVEWSPDKFCHRTVTYVHFLGFRLGPYDVEEWQTGIENYLHENGMVPPITESEPRWKYVRGQQRGVRGLTGPVYGKCVSMGCFHRDKDPLLEWSKSNPKMAEVFWPEFMKFAREERHNLLPDLIGVFLGFEDSANTPQELLDAIAKVAAEE